MKKLSTSLLLLLSVFVYSQQRGTVTIDWNDKVKITFDDFSVNVPQFNPENFSFNDSKKEILFVKKIPATSFVNENSLIISDVIYEAIAENALGDLSRSNIPSSIKASIGNCIARDENKVLLKVSPIIKEGGDFKKIKSFTYSFTYGASASKVTNANTIANSVLSTGKWYRFYVQTSGVYKITKSFLNSLGFSTDGVDPRTIKIYGNGGRMIPLTNSDFYPNDLAENAIQVIGESDGSFDNDDYILFYAEGMDNWSVENYTHLNLYADKSYYYINVDGSNGKRITPFTDATGTVTLSTTTFDDYQFHEVDLINIGHLGRVWFGEPFDINNEQTFTFNFPNIVTTSPALLTAHFGGNSVVTTKFNTTVNGQNLVPSSLSIVQLNSTLVASDVTLQSNVTSATTFNVTLNFDDGGVPTSKGYLDFITIKAKSNLNGFGKQFRFQLNNASSQTGVVQYQFSNATGIKQIWDITDIYNVTAMANPAQSNFAFKANLGTAEKYLAVDDSDYYSPSKESQSTVGNQNLRGTIFNNAQGNFQDIDYLIITPAFLNSQATKLANFHRSYSGLNVKVVNLETIYPEFGGGKQDIGAIRNFVKYVYQNASSTTARVKYVNLFGDASFDFKNRIPNNSNIVPIFQSLESRYHSGSSFASDDYFVIMDPNEGDPLDTYGVDIAVGRMLVSSTQQADEMVNKVIQYHDVQSFGSWRTNYVAIADDPNNDPAHAGDKELQFYQNRLADVIYAQKPFINVKKILMDSYVQETTAGGSRYPQVNDEIRNDFEKGALVFNYLGHGGEDGLAEERIWDKFDGYNFNNPYKYPLFVTITCEFTRFDNPYNPTAGEYTYWNPSGGAISMITTTREIGQGGAQMFNDILFSHLFAYGSDTYTSMAEALRLSKNDASDQGTTQVVLYLGDPALMLAIPKPKIVLTKVNDVPITQPIADLQALAYVKITGEVQLDTGVLDASFNGELAVNIFDKNINRATLGNDGADALISINPQVTAPTMPFVTLGETIFRGNASVTNGQFSFGFVVPKDIKIAVGNGRISFYAKRDQIQIDKTGYNLDIKVGGINANAVVDVTPPKIRLYMNDETFINGGITDQSPYFLAFLDDEHGINTASGIGHDIVAILDGNIASPYVLNDYYETELNDYTKGKIRFPFRNLSLGLHTIVFKAWDVYNNYVTAEIQFVVVSDQDMTLTNVLNYPNPFVNYTQFWFTHNKPYEPLEVQVQILTITGKIVKTINQTVTTDGFLSREITWDGKDDFGDRIGKGVYVYKLTVKSTVSNKKAEKTEKLVIL